MANWIIDPDHSCAAFAIRHLALAYVRGLFTRVNGTIQYDPEDNAGQRRRVAIDVASVNTGVRKRDEHLLTPDFFDQPRYPLITFKSSRVEFHRQGPVQDDGRTDHSRRYPAGHL